MKNKFEFELKLNLNLLILSNPSNLLSSLTYEFSISCYCKVKIVFVFLLILYFDKKSHKKVISKFWRIVSRLKKISTFLDEFDVKCAKGVETLSRQKYIIKWVEEKNRIMTFTFEESAGAVFSSYWVSRKALKIILIPSHTKAQNIPYMYVGSRSRHSIKFHKHNFQILRNISLNIFIHRVN